jgi:hypothetical protein
MLQSLISMPDEQIDLVLDAVKSWCEAHGVSLESHDGRRAINLAVNIVCSRHVNDLGVALREHMELPMAVN